MAELQKLKGFILVYNSTTQTFEVGTNGYAYVFSEGAAVNQQTGSLSGSAGTVLTVFDSGSFAINDYAQIGLNTTPRLVTAVTATTLTLGAGTGTTVAVADRVINVGTSVARTNSKATIYPVDQTTSTPLTASKMTADANGNFECYVTTGDYDILIQNSSGTDLYIDADNSVFMLNRAVTGGTSSQPVTYLQSATDDFMVGGSSAPASMLYVDSTARKVYMGPVSGGTANLAYENTSSTSSIINLYRGTVSATLGPIIKLRADVGAMILATAHTGAQTITFPDATGTVMLRSGTQTVTGATTFSAGLTSSSTTSLSAALQSSSNGYFATGLVVGASTTPAESKSLDIYRLYATKGTQIVAAKIIPSTGFGSAIPATTVVSTSNDTKMQFTVTAGTSPSGTTQVVTITFQDGAFTQAPICMVARNGGSATARTALAWTTTTTTCVITTTGTALSGGDTFVYTVYVFA